MQNQTTPLILTFGVSDPVGAAGIQADLSTFAALGCRALTVVTGLMVGDSVRVEDIQEVDADWVADQGRMLLEDMRVSAIKIGPLMSLEQVSAVAEIVSDYPDMPLILDPFMSGLPEAGMADEDMLAVIRQILIPQTTVLLLSQDELGRMADTLREHAADGVHDTFAQDLEELTDAGCEFVLVKGKSTSLSASLSLTGTHAGGKTMRDVLYGAEGRVAEFEWKHLPGPFLGAGCTLSAAVAALMARGVDGMEAIARAEEFIAGALAHAQRFGMGKLVPNTFYGYTFKESTTS